MNAEELGKQNNTGLHRPDGPNTSHFATNTCMHAHIVHVKTIRCIPTS